MKTINNFFINIFLNLRRTYKQTFSSGITVLKPIGVGKVSIPLSLEQISRIAFSKSFIEKVL